MNIASNYQTIEIIYNISTSIVFIIFIIDMCIESNRIITGRQQVSECDYCNQWQHHICGTSLTLKEYRDAVRNGGLDSLCGVCLAQENEQLADNHDEVISFLL